MEQGDNEDTSVRGDVGAGFETCLWGSYPHYVSLCKSEGGIGVL